GRLASRSRAAPEDDRPIRRRSRQGRRPEGAGGSRGLVARMPLARPTDAPPSAGLLTPTGQSVADLAVNGSHDTEPLIAAEDLPHHVAIIMDGNRRWARRHHLEELEGHAAGVEAIRELLRHVVRRGVPILSLYAFSRENWARPDNEVAGLFSLLEQAV